MADDRKRNLDGAARRTARPGRPVDGQQARGFVTGPSLDTVTSGWSSLAR